MLYDRLKYRIFHFISFCIEFSSKKRCEEARRYPVKRSRKQILCAIFVIAIIAAAYGCRTLARLDIGGKEYNFIRAGLYLLLFSAWGFSLDRRIIQKQVLHYLRMISALIIIWLSLRTVKYELVSDPTVSRYLWYLYYLPMLFIPLFGVFIAMTLGKSENYRLTKKTGMLAIIPSVLFLFVITNDLHQFVFAFSGAPSNPSNGFTHRPIYYACLVWIVGCMTFTLSCLFKKSRIPYGDKRRLTPFLFGCAIVLYGLLYLLGFEFIRRWLGDMNVTFCLLYAAIYESCIQCRMIQSNDNYEELFRISGIGSYIADSDGNIILRSDSAENIAELPLLEKPVIYHGNMRVSSAKISGGYVVWQTDVGRLMALQKRLDVTRKELEENKKALEEAYRVKKELHELREKNRIYDTLEIKAKKQSDSLSAMLENCKTADEAETTRLFKKITVIGSYIKRYANLNFLGAEYELLPKQEIRLTFDETVRALSFYGAQAAAIYQMTKPMRCDAAIFFYEFLENVIEKALDGLQSIVITVFDGEMRLSVECDTNFSEFISERCSVIFEDGSWLISVRYGGEDDA